MALSSRNKRILAASGVVAILIIIVEMTLRLAWGFGDMILFKEDEGFEYIAQPSQNKKRFGNRILYNEYSMRSKPLSSSDRCIVLGFGDSVLNGGTLTDQDSLATSIVEEQLNGRVRFLNISAGSWGPDNCAAYLKKYGDFGAKMFILFVSSHDAHDNMTFEKTVGVHEAYPDRQYALAIIEVLDKYLIPRLLGALGKSRQQNELMINKNGEGFNSGFADILNYSREKDIPLVVCLHAERLEVEQGKFNDQGQEILKFCADNGLKTINGLELGERTTHFRDEIHLNEGGQRLWVDALRTVIESNLSTCNR